MSIRPSNLFLENGPRTVCFPTCITFWTWHRSSGPVKRDFSSDSKDGSALETATDDFSPFFFRVKICLALSHDVTHQRMTLTGDAQHFLKSEAAYNFLLDLSNDYVLKHLWLYWSRNQQGKNAQLSPLFPSGGIPPCAVCVVLCFFFF